MRRPLGLLLASFTSGLTMIGCASVGKDFVRPDDSTLMLGQTTSSEIIERFGPGPQEGTLINNGEKLRMISYGYGNSVYSRHFASMGAHASGVVPARAIGFWFFGDILVGYNFSSSFEVDHTDFEEAKVAQIKERTTTRRDVESLMGPPHGKRVYPMVEGRDEQGIVYAYGQLKQGVGAYSKTLVVTFGPDGLVRKVMFSSHGFK